LVGTKTDLRSDPAALERLAAQGQHPLTGEHGHELAKKLRAVKYLECSAKSTEGLKDVFDEAVRTVLSHKQKKLKGKCTVI
jgi:GTPase SAR1 family protein